MSLFNRNRCGKMQSTSFPSKAKGQAAFSSGFYRFLLAFSVILALSFGVLFYIGVHRAPQETPETQLVQ